MEKIVVSGLASRASASRASDKASDKRVTQRPYLALFGPGCPEVKTVAIAENPCSTMMLERRGVAQFGSALALGARKVPSANPVTPSIFRNQVTQASDKRVTT